MSKESRVKLQTIRKNPIVHEGERALFRTVVNICITLIDFVPVAGEVFSWGADVFKILAFFLHRKKLDLTPDVSILIAVGSEVLEPTLAYAMPTHGIETILQLTHDLPRMKKALAEFRKLSKQTD